MKKPMQVEYRSIAEPSLEEVRDFLDNTKDVHVSAPTVITLKRGGYQRIKLPSLTGGRR